MHALQRPLPDGLEAIWLAALHDAQISPDRALLFPFSGVEGSDGKCACYWDRHTELVAIDLPTELAWALDDMNHDDAFDTYRVSIGTDRSIQAVAALLRHELEHARQFDAHGEDLHGLYDLAIDALNVRAGGLVGGGALYQWIPVEFDANAAGAMFARARFGDDAINELLNVGTPDRAAFMSIAPPGPIETLPERMLFFLAALSNLCEQWAEQAESSLSRRLNFAWKGSREVWSQLGELKLPRHGP